MKKKFSLIAQVNFHYTNKEKACAHIPKEGLEATILIERIMVIYEWIWRVVLDEGRL